MARSASPLAAPLPATPSNTTSSNLLYGIVRSATTQLVYALTADTDWVTVFSRCVLLLGYAYSEQTFTRVMVSVALASTPCKSDGWYPEDRATMAAMSVEGFAATPLPDFFRQISPTPDAWSAVVAKVRELVTADYDWSAAVAALQTPVLLLVGDGDGGESGARGGVLRLARPGQGGR